MAEVLGYSKLAEETLNSVVSVEATLWHHVHKKHAASMKEYYIRNDKVNQLSTEEDDADLPMDTAAKRKQAKKKLVKDDDPEPDADKLQYPNRDAGTRNSTGFVIVMSESKKTLRILMCAHTMDECYAPHVEDFTVELANKFFKFEVTCSHQELNVHKNLGNEISKQIRVKTPASCIALDTEKDLMVLEVVANQIFMGFNSETNIVCTHEHPVIAMVTETPRAQDHCILQGWPPQCI